MARPNQIGEAQEVKLLNLISNQLTRLIGIASAPVINTVISGSANTVVKFGSLGNTLVDSLLKDTGLQVSLTTLIGSGTRIVTADSTGVFSAPSSLVHNGTITSTKFITSGGLSSQLVFGNGDLSTAGYLDSQISSAITSSIVQTITSGDTTHSSSSGALFNALALKQNTLVNPITGTGTTNKLAKWSSSSTEGDSSITDTGALVTIDADTTFSTGNVILGTTTQTENILKLSTMGLSTGLYAWATGITMASATQFNVGSAQGFIVNSLSPLSSPTFVNYPGGSNLTTPYLLTAPATYLLVTPSNTLLMLNTEPTVTERRDNIYLGVVGHPIGTLSGLGNSPDLCLNTFSQLREMFYPLKFINEGIVPYNNGVNLALANTAGKLYGLGIGFITNGNNTPSVLSIAAGAPTTFQYRTQTGVSSANTTLIVPGSYDVAGTVTAIPGGVNQATNQRIYLLQNGNIRVQYGQQIYANISSAISGAQNEGFVVFSNNRTLGILIGILAVTKNCTNLSNVNTARFLPVSKFGETVGAAAGITLSTLQSAYNNSIEPEIVTNSTLDGVTIRRGSAADTDNILVGQNGAGTTTFTLNGNGTMSTTKYTLSALNTAPASSVDTGVTGEIRIVNGAIYVCVNTNTWQRTLLTTF